MKQNTSGQTVGAQMVSATDGSAFTGSVTVFVTIDGGAQAQGTVGSGAATHEGNGYHSYAPSQAETNGAHVAFTFTGTGAIPATAQVYTTFPQTGDSFARLGAPAGASLSADVAAVKAETATIDANVDSILVDTGTDLPATLATIAGYIDTEVAAIKAVTDLLPDAGALTSLATAAAQTTITTHLTDIKGATWASTDSLEAIRDRGDAAWITATGFSTHSAADVWSVTTRQLTGTQAFNLTGNITGNLSGSVGSVTGAVGSVTGAVGSVTGNVGGNVTGSVGSLAAQAKADVNAEVVDAIGTDEIPELAGDPGATPTVKEALMLSYMAIRNKRDTTATSDEIHNNAGTVILDATLSDDAVTFSKSIYAAP